MLNLMEQGLALQAASVKARIVSHDERMVDVIQAAKNMGLNVYANTKTEQSVITDKQIDWAGWEKL